MIVEALVENTSISEEFECEHGLSLYIETKDYKILFDVGASGLFQKNARKLNINIADIDFLIISHGHYDHGGGLQAFLSENKKAEVYLHNLAFGKYYALRPNNKFEFIGLDESIKEYKQIVLTSDQFLIHKGIQLFSNIVKSETAPKSNNGLLMEQGDQLIKDTFIHEQNLIIEDEGKTYLITGCSHNGIVNILNYFHYLKGCMPDYVVGGFHLSSRSSGGNENSDAIKKIGCYLMKTKAKYYTCHCTGLEPYKQLKAIMGENINYLSAGSKLII